MRIGEAFIFAVYAVLVEWLLSRWWQFPTGGELPFAAFTFIGVFTVALVYLRNEALISLKDGAVLGALSVVGVFDVIIMMMQASVYVDYARMSAASAWSTATFMGLYFAIVGSIMLLVPVLCGTAAGAIYVVAKRSLGLFPAPPLNTTASRRSVLFCMAVILGLLALSPTVMLAITLLTSHGRLPLTLASNPNCKKHDPILVQVGHIIFAFGKNDDPSLYGNTIRRAGDFQFCQPRPVGAPFTAGSTTLQIAPERLGYGADRFSNIQVALSRSGETEWSSFRRAQDKMNSMGLTLADLSREGSFLVLTDQSQHYFIATDEAAITPTGQPITFSCDKVDPTKHWSGRCSAFYSWSENVHFLLSFSNKPFAPEEWLDLHAAARQLLLNAERRAAQKQEE